MKTAQQLLNRNELEQSLSALTPQQQVSLALLDVDNFADINADYGHGGGDDVLRALEKVLTSSVPDEAMVARIGGDEYAVALPDTPPESALILLEEIRSHFSSRQPSGNVPRKVHLSVGIASRPPHAQSTHELLLVASEALYRAKHEGRGRVAIYMESKMTLKSNYYSKASLEKLSKLSAALNKTEASLLREALEDLFIKHSGEL